VHPVTGVTETERTLRLAQVQDNLVDLRQLRRTLRSLRTYFRSNVVGGGLKTQTKSRTIKSGVTVRINRAVRRYRLAYTALLSLDPTGDWRKEYLELTDKDNRGPGKEQDEQGVGDGHYMMSWIWRGSTGNEGEEVNETVRHEWMTCRARADHWREESDLLQEEMCRVVASLEWKLSLWGGRVGSRSGSTTADIQSGIDGYARKQAATYHHLAVSLANQWIPHLLTSGLDISWVKTYPWAAEVMSLQVERSRDSSDLCDNPSSAGAIRASEEQDVPTKPTFDDDRDESDDGDYLQFDELGGSCDEGESTDIGFEYDDKYMS